MDSELEIPLYILRLGDTGITWIDLLLIILCPAAGFLGTFVASIMQRKQISKSISEDFYLETQIQSSHSRNITNHQMRNNELRAEYEQFLAKEYRLATRGNGIVGFALGMIVALYFFGAITQDVTSLARVVALCILFGYQSPNLWKVQERVISDIVESKIFGLNQNIQKHAGQK